MAHIAQTAIGVRSAEAQIRITIESPKKGLSAWSQANDRYAGDVRHGPARLTVVHLHDRLPDTTHVRAGALEPATAGSNSISIRGIGTRFAAERGADRHGAERRTTA
ncbi:hypothetical protein ACFVGY_04265 [Streptomyces sp. NPDC127106]|uniref:hypothetical protein n=1 Tax=Streptomyces sp. NPDC127106 TaxID=3345360 RepID=UPI00363C860B